MSKETKAEFARRAHENKARVVNRIVERSEGRMSREEATKRVEKSFERLYRSR